MIVFSIFFYTKETLFPATAAIFPTLGTALIILGGMGKATLISRIISLKPIVFIGLISYSLYLWHWPIIVYSKYYLIKEPSVYHICGMIFTTLFLSILSWKYIETPFRKKKISAKQKDIFISSSLISITIIILGLLLINNHGLPNRYKNTIQLKDSEWVHWTECTKRSVDSLCNIGEENAKESFILWGDSHAKAFATAIDIAAKKHNINGKIATKTACPPLISIERMGSNSCQKFNEEILQYIANKKELKTVILAARWALSAKGTRYKQEIGENIHLIDLQAPIKRGSINISNNTELFKLGINRTVNSIQQLGKKVIIIQSIPEIGYDVPSADFIATVTNRDTNTIISPSLTEYHKRTNEVNIIFHQLESKRSMTGVLALFSRL